MRPHALFPVLLLAASALARDFDVRVVEPPGRLGEASTTRVLQGSVPGISVVPTGSGELVLSGSRSALDAAMRLLQKLDRPAREVVVEVRRTGSETRVVDERRLGVGLGGAESPTVLSRTRGTSRSSGGRTLRLQEGGKASLFVGDQVPFRTGAFGETRFIDAGASVELSLVRVDPGEGALLEVAAGDGGLGASTAAGPVIRRERVGTRVFARFGVPTLIGGYDASGGDILGGAQAQGSLTIEETGRGPDGRPTRRFVRRPLRGSASIGRRRSASSGGTAFTVVVREVR